MEPYITSSEILDDDIRQFIIENPILLISGIPMRHHSSDGYDYLYACKPVDRIPLIVRQVLIQTIPVIGHRHLGEEFIGTYPTVSGVHEETGDEYCFGIRDCLGFVIEAAQTD